MCCCIHETPLNIISDFWEAKLHLLMTDDNGHVMHNMQILVVWVIIFVINSYLTESYNYYGDN